jgi:hypothetical protein
MPKLSPLDDIATYRKVADESYGRKFSTGIQSPVEATAKRMGDAENAAMGQANLPNGAPPAAAIPGVKFTKGFTPAERATQAAALQKKLAERGD